MDELSDGNERLDLDARELCADGACTGVLGPDGRCKVCGRGAASEPAAMPANGADRAAPSSAEAGGSTDADEPQPAADDDFGARQLCADGACTGLVGPDGNCKLCGRPAAS